MARTKSLLIQTRIDRAIKAHNCRASAKHRIQKGDVRLKVRNGRSWIHYCAACAKVIISKDTAKLAELQYLRPESTISA